jgi:transcription elongation factor GreA-like protein
MINKNIIFFIIKLIFLINSDLNETEPLYFDKLTNNIVIHADVLNINSTGGISFDLYVIKGSRVGVSQRMSVSLNMSSLIVISKDTDVKEMAKQLDKLDDFAKKNPVKALSILSSFVEAINEKAEDVAQVILIIILY